MRALQYGIALMLSIIMLASCSNDTDDANDAMVAFQVAVTNIESYKATVTITHNGTNRDTYYGFYVRGKVSDVEGEIRKMLASDQKANVLASPLNQRKRVLKVSGLLPRREFTYIVFGMDSNGNRYGTPASVTFTTAATPIVATLNSNWTVTPIGHTVYNDYDYTQIDVDVTGEVEERFFLYLCAPSLPTTYDCIEDFIIAAIDEFTKNNNAEGDKDFWLDASKVRTESTYFYRHLQPGDYIAYAIGVNEDGTPTGKYAKCEAFHVDKYPYTEDFANLINNKWHFTDETGQRYDVTFEEKKLNSSLIMKGWGNYDELEVTVLYDRSNRSLSIKTQTIPYYFTLYLSSGELTSIPELVGAYYNAEGLLKVTTQSHTITHGKLNDAGDYVFTTAFSMTLADGTKAKELGMCYALHKNGVATVFSCMMFPFTLTKTE